MLDGNSDLGTKRIGRTVVHGMGLFVKIRDPVQHDSPAPYSVTWWKEGVLSGYTGKKRGRACARVYGGKRGLVEIVTEYGAGESCWTETQISEQKE